MMLKTRQHVICVNPGEEYFCDLTEGETYFISEMTDSPVPFVRVVNDFNRQAFYRSWRFQPMLERN